MPIPWLDFYITYSILESTSNFVESIIMDDTHAGIGFCFPLFLPSSYRTLLIHNLGKRTLQERLTFLPGLNSLAVD